MQKINKWILSSMLLVGGVAGPVMAMAQRPNPDAPPPPAWVQLVPFGVMFVVFYFLLIRPQLRQKKEKDQMMGAIKKGDKVVTQGGLIVTVSNILPTTLEVKINDETKAKILRSAVIEVYSDQAEAKDVTPVGS